MRPINILHLIIDDKFFDFTFRVFQEAGGVENRYVALTGEITQQFNHIGNIPLWRLASTDYADSPQVTEDLEWCDVLIIHWWHSAAASVVAKVTDSVIVVWSGWGGDYYDLLPEGGGALYGERTKELMQQIYDAHNVYESINDRILNSLRRIKRALMCAFGKPKKQILSNKNVLIKRVDYFSAPIPDDYELLKNALGHQFRAEYVQLNYGSVEQTFAFGGLGVSGRDILLGNSATETNNHLEIINMLASIDLGDRKVIVPLSYGTEEYADEIERCGRRLLGNHFVAIRKFMPLDEYNLLISNCSIAIMNHRRQQALGNIGTMLYLGAKIFFDEHNVVYKFLIRKGVHVFSISEITQYSANAFAPLSQAEKERNIQVINQVWGHDKVIDNIRIFVDRMHQHKATHA